MGHNLVHESGHWFSLEHPFVGGCSEPNDGVSDTAQVRSAPHPPPRPFNTIQPPKCSPPGGRPPQGDWQGLIALRNEVEQ